jgi:acyl carrier protein
MFCASIPLGQIDYGKLPSSIARDQSFPTLTGYPLRYAWRFVTTVVRAGERDPMDHIERIRNILRDSLQLGDRATALQRSSQLLGSIPEFDSMAVVTVLTLIEDEYGISIADDEISAETFETLGSLADFVAARAPA